MSIMKKKVLVLFDKLNVEETSYNSACNNVLSFDSAVVVSFLNYHALNLAVENEAMNAALNRSSFLYRDGVGIDVLMNSINRTSGLNLNGTDLIPLILEGSIKDNIPVVLFGSNCINNQKATDSLKLLGVNVTLSCDGYEHDSHYLDLMSELWGRSPIVILGMGMPRQEILSFKLSDSCPSYNKCLIINGGAIIDRLAGVVNRAPVFFVKNNLEWLYRLYKEPVRLFKRVFVGGFKLIKIIICFKL